MGPISTPACECIEVDWLCLRRPPWAKSSLAIPFPAGAALGLAFAPSRDNSYWEGSIGQGGSKYYKFVRVRCLSQSWDSKEDFLREDCMAEPERRDGYIHSLNFLRLPHLHLVICYKMIFFFFLKKVFFVPTLLFKLYLGLLYHIFTPQALAVRGLLGWLSVWCW